MRWWSFLAASAIGLTLASAAWSQKLQYIATLTGVSQSPPNASPGIGTAVVTFDFAGNITMRVEALFGNLTGTVTAANINAPTASPNTGTAGIATQLPTFTDFPSGVTSGHYVSTFDMLQASTYNPAFITASGGTTSFARGALMTAMQDRKAYFNLRTSTFPDGEIRGFFAFNDMRGDFNSDDAVDAADYVVWRNSVGLMGSGLAADANMDGKVDGADYALWQANFGHIFIESIGATASGDAGGAGLGQASIPEPGSIVLLFVSLGAAVTRRWR